MEEKLSKLTINPAPSQERVKEEEEEDGDSREGYLRCFRFQFINDCKTYKITCKQPCTVLEALKTRDEYNAKNYSDNNIVIQLGRAGKDIAVATHFPCHLIEDDGLVVISCKPKQVEETQDPQHAILPQSRYITFCIDTVGGRNAKTKKLFINNAFKRFKYLCVYAEKEITVEEALKRDGRFRKDLGNFTLSDNADSDLCIEHDHQVNDLDGKELKICLPRGLNLKQWTESRFPGDSYQKALDLRKEDFGKIQQSFSEVHRVRKLLELSHSVCKVVVGDVCQGTGFILFDNFILTNAHLFENCVVQDGDKWQVTTDVHAIFNYEEPSGRNSYRVKVKKTITDCHYEASGDELDYAILELELDPDTQTAAPQTKQKPKLPPGLLKICGPVPVNGEACIIGHPAGGVKKLDPICIIEKEKRKEAKDKYVDTYQDHVFSLYSVGEVIKNQPRTKNQVVTYNTFMYHGSSGSPVFDAHGRVFGLHTGGFCKETDSSVIEYAHPLIAIFKTFVIKLKKSKNDELLEKVKEEVKNNLYLKAPLKEALESVSDVKPSDPVEPMETS